MIPSKKTGRVVTIENAIIRGGLGAEIEDLIIENRLPAKLEKVGVGDYPLCQGKIDELCEQEGMDIHSILAKSIRLITE